jgi:ADP-heptose:LPS heptosyltransferase
MIGDVIQTTALLGDLRSAFPGAWIAYMTGNAGEAVLRRNPYVDQVMPYLHCPGGKATDVLRFFGRVWQLRKANFDLGISLNNGSWDALILRLAGVRFAIGFVEPLREFLLDKALVWDEDEVKPRQERFDDLLRLLGIEPSFRHYVFPESSTVGEHVRALVEEAAAIRKPLLAVAPGGASHPPGAKPYRQWLPERFAEVVCHLGEQHSLLPVLIGDREDLETARLVFAALTPEQRAQTRDLTGRTSLDDLAFLLRHARLLLTNDSAPVWIAAAVGCPTVCLFGCTHPAAATPLTSWYKAVSCRLPCHPCYRGDRVPACPVPPDCVTGVTPQDVTSAAENVLRMSASDRAVGMTGSPDTCPPGMSALKREG